MFNTRAIPHFSDSCMRYQVLTEANITLHSTVTIIYIPPDTPNSAHTACLCVLDNSDNKRLLF
jgi:hypothetical protein